MNLFNETSVPTLIPTTFPSSLPALLQGAPSSSLSSIPPTLHPSLSVAPSIESELIRSLSCHDLDPGTFYWCPAHRYCDWDGQAPSNQKWLTDHLSYERQTWNFYEINTGIEYVYYEDLSRQATNSLSELGYDIDKHECCFTHYELYGWFEFDLYQMVDEKGAWETVGYDQNTWDNGLNIPNVNLIWEELPGEVQDSLQEYLCYSREIWDQIALDDWPEDAVLPGSYEMEGIIEMENIIEEKIVVELMNEDGNDIEVQEENVDIMDDNTIEIKIEEKKGLASEIDAELSGVIGGEKNNVSSSPNVYAFSVRPIMSVLLYASLLVLL